MQLLYMRERLAQVNGKCASTTGLFIKEYCSVNTGKIGYRNFALTSFLDLGRKTYFGNPIIIVWIQSIMLCHHH